MFSYTLSLAFKYTRQILRSRYKWLLVFFSVWLFRVDYIVNDTGGVARLVQVGTILAIFLFIYRQNEHSLRRCYKSKFVSIQSCFFLYAFAVISTWWSYNPLMTLTLAGQNIILIIAAVWCMKQCKTFKEVEVCGIMFMFTMALMETLIEMTRGESIHIFQHMLPPASVCAITSSYCIGEYMQVRAQEKREHRKKRKNTESTSLYPRRRTLLKGVFVLSVIILLVNTSSGANVATLVGFGAALFFSGNFFFSFLVLGVGLFFAIHPELIEPIIMLIMPGKDLKTLRNVTGRTEMWEVMIYYGNRRPWMGWGFAQIERVISDVVDDLVVPDAHNNYIGFYGSLGITGLLLYGLHIIATAWDIVKNRLTPGMTGLATAFIAIAVNGYTYGFLSGKSCSITVAYFVLVAMVGQFVKVEKDSKTQAEQEAETEEGTVLEGEEGDTTDDTEGNEAGTDDAEGGDDNADGNLTDENSEDDKNERYYPRRRRGYILIDR